MCVYKVLRQAKVQSKIILNNKKVPETETDQDSKTQSGNKLGGDLGEIVAIGAEIWPLIGSRENFFLFRGLIVILW